VLCYYVAVTVDTLPMSDEHGAQMPSAPPGHAMDVIPGYDAMDDSKCYCSKVYAFAVFVF